jgi:hypothetical protein
MVHRVVYVEHSLPVGRGHSYVNLHHLQAGPGTSGKGQRQRQGVLAERRTVQGYKDEAKHRDSPVRGTGRPGRHPARAGTLPNRCSASAGWCPGLPACIFSSVAGLVGKPRAGNGREPPAAAGGRASVSEAVNGFTVGPARGARRGHPGARETSNHFRTRAGANGAVSVRRRGTVDHAAQAGTAPNPAPIPHDWPDPEPGMAIAKPGKAWTRRGSRSQEQGWRRRGPPDRSSGRAAGGCAWCGNDLSQDLDEQALGQTLSFLPVRGVCRRSLPRGEGAAYPFGYQPLNHAVDSGCIPASTVSPLRFRRGRS